MRVIITGGTGLIGSTLANNLHRDGHETIVLTRSLDSAPRHRLRPGVRIASWDAKSSDGWADLADGADAIVNLAGSNLAAGRWTQRRKDIIVSSRLNAGHAVVDAIRRVDRKPEVVIQASGSNYYGPGAGTVDERAGPGDDFLARVCVAWEESTAAVEELGVRRAIIRSGAVLSTQAGALPRLTLPFRFFVGGRLGNGQQHFPWIHLADEISAIRFLIAKESATGPYNLSAPEPVTNRELARAIGRAMGRPSIMPVPAAVIRLLFGEMATVVLDGRHTHPRRLLEEGFTFRFPEIQPALDNLLG